MKNGFVYRIGIVLLIVVAFALGRFSPVFAQTPDAPVYTMGLSRDFGYGNGSQIRGTFSAHIAGPEGITKVVYRIDGQVLAEVSAAPFSFQFNTSSYAVGAHTIIAEVTAADGMVYTTASRTYDFVSQAQESEGMKNILIPLLGVLGGIVLISVLVQTVIFRKKGASVPMGAARNYGYAGGSICPRCHRPTPRHVWGFNVGIGKFDYCENCGKWSVMRRMPIELLRGAEEAEKAHADAASSQPLYEQTEQEKLREMVDKSKYDNQG